MSNMSAIRSEGYAADESAASTAASDTAAAREPGAFYTTSKRTIDVVVAALALVVTSPICLVVAMAVRFTSRGPVLFRSERIGRDGRPFTMLKFRSMYVDADHSRQIEFNRLELAGDVGELDEFSLSDDDRITRVGLFLRRTSLDELPQLWNVIRGEMSLVGPRPSLDWEVELFESRHLERLDVLPGVTGLWQVSGRRTIDMRGMLEIDLDYVRRRSLGLDLKILALTVPAVLRQDGAT